MNLDYQETYQMEILNEFASSVYAKVVNLVTAQDLDVHDESHFLVKFMHQLGDAKQGILDAHSLTELDNMRDYWQAMNNYTDNLLVKHEVA